MLCSIAYKKIRYEIASIKILINTNKDRMLLVIYFLLLIQIVVNFLGVLGPEIGFDALWYHLTLPKIYIDLHRIVHIPGGLLYYSDMPKLIELLYIPALFLGNETTAKFIHYLFGIAILFILFKLSKKFMNTKFALVTVLIFYTNLVVGWESTSAYIDLGRTFFELLAFSSFLSWWETESAKDFTLSSIFTGLAITTKILSFGTFVIFLLFILIHRVKKRKNIYKTIKRLLLFTIFSLVIPLPWFIFSYLHTANPFYPFFTQTYPVSVHAMLFSPSYFITSMISLLLFSSDPISPLYLIFLPLIILLFPKFPTSVKIITLFCLFSICIWYITPQTGGGRFFLPYLPELSLLCGFILQKLNTNPLKFFYTLGIGALLVISFVSIGYRGMANAKYIPYILHKESKEMFLANHLHFEYGDFVDTDGYFKNHIKSNDLVLLFGFHNLYYLNFPFVDSSWVTKNDHVTYIATQNTKLPITYQSWHLVYRNQKTLVQLYKMRKD